ncbi:hypothetical protein [Streptomyces sp. UG1]|uniref:hypothetical protein n=1 Tax=Streptomyces sp. UG1 TaxID=3417652 RepID=UPI003CF05C6D
MAALPLAEQRPTRDCGDDVQREQPALHAVGDLTLTGRVETTLRTDTPDGDRPALLVGCDGRTEPAATLRILTIGEHIEVYADGVFALTTLCY